MCIPKRRQPSARGLARSSSSRTATASKSTIHPAKFWPARNVRRGDERRQATRVPAAEEEGLRKGAGEAPRRARQAPGMGEAATRQDLHRPPQVLARGERERADAPPHAADRGRSQDLEALADGPPVLLALVRLLPCARRDVRRYRPALCALVRGPLRRQAACAPEPDPPPAFADSL